MIFVTTGTVGFPFKRLINEVVRIASTMASTDFIVQDNYHSVSTPLNMTVCSYYSFSETIKLYRTADVVITAGGEASTLLASRYSKRILIVVPRQKRFGEHVDDQQVEIGKYVASRKLAVIINEMPELHNTLLQVSNTKQKKRTMSIRSPIELVRNLDNWMQNWQ